MSKHKIRVIDDIKLIGFSINPEGIVESEFNILKEHQEQIEGEK